MGCIETLFSHTLAYALLGLTLTWDVLKQSVPQEIEPKRYRLTLTWDVLKRYLVIQGNNPEGRLTLTWDVLKHSFSLASASEFVINFNMGCIETT